uniref:Uncharacterized protein n=1 Tax=Bos mutus grunniens TaxID=30521 RepID=A0A8B9X0W1_BOSMU
MIVLRGLRDSQYSPHDQIALKNLQSDVPEKRSDFTEGTLASQNTKMISSIVISQLIDENKSKENGAADMGTGSPTWTTGRISFLQAPRGHGQERAHWCSARVSISGCPSRVPIPSTIWTGPSRSLWSHLSLLALRCTDPSCPST